MNDDDFDPPTGYSDILKDCDDKFKEFRKAIIKLNGFTTYGQRKEYTDLLIGSLVLMSERIDRLIVLDD